MATPPGDQTLVAVTAHDVARIFGEVPEPLTRTTRNLQHSLLLAQSPRKSIASVEHRKCLTCDTNPWSLCILRVIHATDQLCAKNS